MKLSRSAIAVAGLMAVAAAPTHGQNLIDVYRLGLANDAKFAGARGTHAAGIEKYYQGLSQLLPTLNANSERTSYDSDIEYGSNTSFEGGSRQYKERKYSVTLTQPLYRKQNIAAYQQGKAQEAAADAQLVMARHDLIMRIAQAYFDLLSAEQDAATAAAHVTTTRAQADSAVAKLQAGSATRIEVAEARARADVAIADEISAKNALVDKRNALRRLTNEVPGALDELRPQFELPSPAAQNLSAWIETAQQQNPQLQTLHHSVKSAEYEIERARGGHFPNVDVFAGASSNYSTGSIYTSASSDTRYTSVGMKVEFNFYQGGAISSRVREAVGLLTKAQSELEDARREVAGQVTQAFNASLNGAAKVRALERAHTSAVESANASRRAFEVGVRNLLEVLDAEQRSYDIARDLIRARQDYVLSWLRLKGIAGQLDETDLETLNSHLVPPSMRPGETYERPASAS